MVRNGIPGPYRPAWLATPLLRAGSRRPAWRGSTTRRNGTTPPCRIRSSSRMRATPSTGAMPSVAWARRLRTAACGWRRQTPAPSSISSRRRGSAIFGSRSPAWIRSEWDWEADPGRGMTTAVSPASTRLQLESCPAAMRLARGPSPANVHGATACRGTRRTDESHCRERKPVDDSSSDIVTRGRIYRR
jgi:hypothetical protein